jgi:hypothetical protein
MEQAKRERESGMNTRREQMTATQSTTPAAPAEELATVRHMATGLYLEVMRSARRISAPAADDGTPVNLWTGWGPQADASILSCKVAAAVAAAYIVLTGDHDVGLEPVEEVAP